MIVCLNSVSLQVQSLCAAYNGPVDRSYWHPCTNVWTPLPTTPLDRHLACLLGSPLEPRICRPGRIDHWMYERDNARALLTYNRCSQYAPGPEHRLCEGAQR